MRTQRSQTHSPALGDYLASFYKQLWHQIPQICHQGSVTIRKGSCSCVRTAVCVTSSGPRWRHIRGCTQGWSLSSVTSALKASHRKTISNRTWWPTWILANCDVIAITCYELSDHNLRKTKVTWPVLCASEKLRSFIWLAWKSVGDILPPYMWMETLCENKEFGSLLVLPWKVLLWVISFVANIL